MPRAESRRPAPGRGNEFGTIDLQTISKIRCHSARTGDAGYGVAGWVGERWSPGFLAVSRNAARNSPFRSGVRAAREEQGWVIGRGDTALIIPPIKYQRREWHLRPLCLWFRGLAKSTEFDSVPLRYFSICETKNRQPKIRGLDSRGNYEDYS